MGKRLSRREFVKGAAVATAGAVLSGWGRALVRQEAQSIKEKAAEAVDPDPEPAIGDWREPRERDDRHADLFRAALVGARMFPAHSLDDPAFDAMVANTRAGLQQIVEELDRADLCALFEAARAMALHPPFPEFFETAKGIYARRSA